MDVPKTSSDDCFLEKGPFLNSGWQFFRKDTVTVLTQISTAPVSMWIEI